MIVELHTLRPSGVVDITGHVSSLTIKHSVRPPYQSISVVMYRGVDLWSVYRPRPGDWIVVRDADGKTIQAGCVASTNVSLASTGPALSSSPLQVQAVGWFDLLASVDLVVAPAHQPDGTGTLFSVNWWSTVVQEIAASVGVTVGEALSRVFRRIAQMMFPETLGGQVIGTAARVVYDAVSAEQYAPGIDVEAVPGTTIDLLRSVAPSRTTVGSILSGTFVPDQYLVEMFPVWSEFGRPPAHDPLEGSFVTDSSGAIVTVDGYEADIDDELLLRGLHPSQQIKGLSGTSAKIPKPRVANQDAVGPGSGSAGSFGRNPVIVYRMAPLRMQALDQLVANPSRLAPGMLTGVTWRGNDAVHVPADRVDRVQLQWSHEDHFNVSAVDLPNAPDSGARWWTESGLPLASYDRVWSRGLKALEPNWPFFPTRGDVGDTGDLMLRSYTVAAHAAAVWMLADRFARGSIQIQGEFPVRLGFPVRVDVGPGRWLTAYVTEVTQTWDVPQSAIASSTQASISHALLSDDEDLRFITETLS